MVGAFGDDSGARPDVWICPLWRLDHEDPNDNCSTFAYKWATGTISGEISGLREDDEAMVTLTPVNSNEDYEDDLADDMEDHRGCRAALPSTPSRVSRTAGTWSRSKPTPGSWEEDESGVLSVMHDEDNDDEDYTGDSAGDDLSATDLRGVIRGRIA